MITAGRHIQQKDHNTLLGCNISYRRIHTMKFSMLAIAAAALSAGVHGFAGTPLKARFAVQVCNSVVSLDDGRVVVRTVHTALRCVCGWHVQGHDGMFAMRHFSSGCRRVTLISLWCCYSAYSPQNRSQDCGCLFFFCTCHGLPITLLLPIITFNR